MKCVICHGEEIEMENVREEIAMGNDVVYVPVRVLVCRNCGERYFDRRTLQYLEKVQEQLKTGQAVLAEVGKVMELSG
jgi:YgiT-type zinc finger domain-containing protein